MWARFILPIFNQYLFNAKILRDLTNENSRNHRYDERIIDLLFLLDQSTG